MYVETEFVHGILSRVRAKKLLVNLGNTSLGKSFTMCLVLGFCKNPSQILLNYYMYMENVYTIYN
jgi:hypothetical protein